MQISALILGMENVKGPGKGDNPKPFDFWKVNFIDTENPSGSPQTMTLPKDGEKLKSLLPQFEAARMKTAKINAYQNGAYLNFVSFVTA